jgi:hypothetical protein
MHSGATCGSCAVSGTPLCYHHSAIKTALGKAASASNIPFIFPEDRTSLQINYFLLLQAYSEGRIDLRTFNAMQRLLRSMASNLGKKSLAEDHANAAETPAAPNPSNIASTEKEIKTLAAAADTPNAAAPHERSAGHERSAVKDRPTHSAPVSKPSNHAFPSFEDIAAQHRPLGESCFLTKPNHSHPASPLTAC